MKQKAWLLQLPIIFLCTFAFYINQAGEEGQLNQPILRDHVFPYLRSISGKFTNLKFILRGEEKPKNKVVIVAIDEGSLESYGRWPWHRNTIAYLIDQIFAAGAKVVGLDVVFAEPDVRVPEDLAQVLRNHGLGQHVERAETDRYLTRTIHRHRDRLVLGWATENGCQPGYSEFDECPVTHPDALATHPYGFEKFSYSHVKMPANFNPQKTPIMSLVTVISNLPDFDAPARHSGTFNIWQDSDGYFRRSPLLIMANGQPFPTLAIEMARVGLGEELAIELNEEMKVSRLYFKHTQREIPVSPLGTTEINFRGSAFTFPYVPAEDVMSGEHEVHIGMNREIASTREGVFQDAYVLIGATATGIYDMRAFPFDPDTPGVEGHATILDNILSNDFLVSASSGGSSFWIYILMLFFALGMAYATHRLNAIPALSLFGAGLFVFGLFDLKILFENNINWNTSFLYIEMGMIAVFTLAAKYILEENQKKFIHGAFGRYISPGMVDAIVKDPDKLKLGGEKRELSILFSDIRGFTTLSEKMDAKFLAKFLNEYLSEMTKIIVEDTNGTLDKYIGDAIMAFWGSPIPQKNHAANSCRAAVMMMKRLREMKDQFRKDYGITVDIGIGINTGLVSVGNMGSEKNFNYTVLGDHVNLASRLEGLTKPYGSSIVISRHTIDQIEESGEEVPAHRTLDFVKVKGKKNAVELLQLLDFEASEKGLELFEEARQLYNKQKWDEAISKFEAADELLRINPNKPDGPSKMYIDRCQIFKESPPGDAWDGTWEMTSK